MFKLNLNVGPVKKNSLENGPPSEKGWSTPGVNYSKKIDRPLIALYRKLQKATQGCNDQN